MAAGTITASDVTANLSESYSEPEPPTANPASIFGNPNPSTVGNAAFNRGAMDSLIGGDDDFIAQGGIIDYYPLDINGDGEI